MASFPELPEVSYPNQLDDRHQGQKITITAALCLCVSAVVFATRLMIRWPWPRLFGLDDGAAIAASLFALTQWMIIISAVSQGLGTAMELVSEESASQVRKLMFAGDLFYVLALSWSKLSVYLFFRRLSASTQQTLLPNILTCACAALSTISMFVIGIRQSTTEPWLKPSTLDRSTIHRWIVVEAFAILIDLAIMTFPVNLVWGLQMRNSMKFWVAAGFGIRLPLIPIATMRLESLRTSLASEEPLLDAAMTEYYTQAEMTFSLIAATIPCLRIFMEAAKTGLLGVSMWGANTTTGGSYTRSYAGKEAGTISRLKSSVSKGHEEVDAIQLRDWNQSSNSASVHATSDKISVASDSSETAIIVRQTVDVRYEQG